MKNRSIFMAALCAIALSMSFASCDKINSPDSCEKSSEGENLKIPIHFSLNGSWTTKSSVITGGDEESVGSVQLFVFDARGLIESYKKVTQSSSLTMSVTAGSKKIRAIVNAPDITGIAKISDFDTMRSGLVDNAGNAFVMVGSDEIEVTEEDEFTIDVNRLVSKIRIQKITTAFTSASLASETFTIDSIYVVNVAADAFYYLDGEPTKWLNKRSWQTSGVDALLAEKLNDVALTGNSSYSNTHSFYVYPNPTDGDNSDVVWSPRHTRLVVQATLRGETVYYPVTLPVLTKNKCYTISELIITRPGSSSPDEPVSIQTCSFTVNVVDWDMTLDPYSETI